jgi:hypothetical protein
METTSDNNTLSENDKIVVENLVALSPSKEYIL